MRRCQRFLVNIIGAGAVLIAISAWNDPVAHAQGCAVAEVTAAGGPATIINQNFTKLSDCFRELQQRLAEVRQLRDQLIAEKQDRKGGLSSGSSETTHDATHIKYGPGTCPRGQYAAGVKAWGNPGRECTGCFNGIQVICRSFVEN